MQQLSDFTLLSDLDGTLINHSEEIPQRNLDAIERFVAKGGHFGVATGRSRGLARAILRDRLPINAPCILYNGGVIYDYAEDRMITQHHLPEGAEGYLRRIMQEIEQVGVLVISGDSYYQIREERSFARYNQEHRKHYIQSELDQVARPWFKALFQVRPENYDPFLSAVGALSFPGVRFVGINTTLIEMLPEGSSKGRAIEEMIGMGLVQRENLVAVGDFYNDLEMIELAGIGATLATSPKDIQAKADLIVGDCERGAVADVIEHLEEICGA